MCAGKGGGATFVFAIETAMFLTTFEKNRNNLIGSNQYFSPVRRTANFLVIVPKPHKLHMWNRF